uniref:Uncharacterized protein n=1 Tax=Anguilla anguilla TaxID=7936 RepID=A0A0E9Q010_ANGAN
MTLKIRRLIVSGTVRMTHDNA